MEDVKRKPGQSRDIKGAKKIKKVSRKMGHADTKGWKSAKKTDNVSE